MTTRDSDDAPLDRRAKAILETVRECWKALSDLDIPDSVVALDRLDQLLGLEALTHIPEAAPERRH